MEGHKTFKVIIAGGSVAGLTLANALERAGVDFLLLEKRDIAPNVGQSIFVLPCSALVLEQLGVNKTLDDGSVPIQTREHWDAEMNKFCTSDELWLLYKKYNFLRSLSDGVKDKSKIRSREGLVSFIETAHGVTVRTDKDNVYEGSILVGADGVHSEVRRQLAAFVEKEQHDAETARVLTSGFKTRYACLTAMSWNRFAGDPERPFLADGLANNSYHARERIGGISCAAVRARDGEPGQLMWSAYIPLDVLGSAPCGYPSPRFTQADVDAFLHRYGHLRLCPDYTFADVHESLIGASIICMEENVLPARWSSPGGRVVLLGDAVHKATANLGMGGNLCIDDVCRLVNGLVPLVARAASAGGPGTEELSGLFDECERNGRGRAKFVYNASAFFCGFETFNAWYARLVQWVFPWIPSGLKMKVFSIFDSAAPKLDFLPVPQARFRGE